MSKIIETIMYRGPEMHLKSNNILASEQFGFRKDAHIDGAIFNFTNNTLTALNQQLHVGGIFLRSN